MKNNMNEEIKKLWRKWDETTNNRLSRVCLYSDDSGDFYDDEDNVLFTFDNYEDLQEFFEDALANMKSKKKKKGIALDTKFTYCSRAVIITGGTFRDVDMISCPVVTQVRITFENGDTDYVEFNDLVEHANSVEFILTSGSGEAFE